VYLYKTQRSKSAMQGASESMLIGSPTGPSQTQSPFLPSYLMGDSSALAQSV